MCSELRVAVCTIVGIISEEEDASELFFELEYQRTDCYSCVLHLSRDFVEEGQPVDAAVSGATTSVIRAMTSGAGLSTLDGRLSNSSNSG
ncbi:hypothetical protein Tco_0428169 [Tanacetum coccineum]